MQLWLSETHSLCRFVPIQNEKDLRFFQFGTWIEKKQKAFKLFTIFSFYFFVREEEEERFAKRKDEQDKKKNGDGKEETEVE